MDKKFWEREDFDIQMFCAVFQGVYKVYYDSCDYGEEYTTNVWKGVALCRDPKNAPLLKAYADAVFDAPTSDREMATFAVTYHIFESYNGTKK